jgi:outer membrane protein TolC
VEVRLAIAREVAQAWIRRSTADASLRDLVALEPEVQLQATAARARVSSGRASTVEALGAEAAVAQLHNRILRMQSEVRKAGSELARWIDADAQRPLAAMPSLDELPTPPSALLASVHEHGSLLPFAAQIEAARLDVSLAKAERRPDWSAEFAFSKRGAEFSDMVSLQFRIGLPLFTKYRQDPTVSARHAELRRLEAERDAEIRMHTAELRQMLADWEQLGQQLQQYEREILPLARARSRAAIASFCAGRGDLRLALEAYAQEIDAIVERAQLSSERGRAWAFLRYLGPEHLHGQEGRP